MPQVSHALQEKLLLNIQLNVIVGFKEKKENQMRLGDLRGG